MTGTDGVGEEATAVAEAAPAVEDQQPNATAIDTTRVNRTVTFNDETSRVYRTVTVNDFDGCMRYDSDDDDYQTHSGGYLCGTVD